MRQENIQASSRAECWVGTSHLQHSMLMDAEVPDGMVLECMAEESQGPKPSFADRAVNLIQAEVDALRLRSEKQ